ncbi:LLM class flavin-dependent oxidoreductase [Streptomyces blattellae]|uniref:LLM class flavin-dependent oxidoreductase n=1 Tax=Streptomyces blattellae TaxID=2569855 RepID=UPI0012B9A0BC|nr:LLM class flavin-dependent oxidoreductase [Streptomyces blattellae]
MTLIPDHGPMQFGLFVAPQHYPKQNPTRALRRDLETLAYAESLGFVEGWVGEHHSTGHEIIASPEVFLAAAIERTQRMRLGTGVASLPYHHPFHVAQRAVLLDHLSMGRSILGVGPGSLPSDAAMIGVPWSETRDRMAESIDVILKLLTSEEGVTHHSPWFTLDDAYLQVKPFQQPTPELVFTSMESPFGPTLAGKYGAGLLSLGASSRRGYAALSNMWRIAEEQAAVHGNTVSRSQYRVVAFMHVAETRERAYAEVEKGFPRHMDYVANVSERTFAWMEEQAESNGAPEGPPVQPTVQQMIEGVRDTHLICVGDPDDAIAFIEHMYHAADGFGTLLVISGTDWAAQDAEFRSLELISREVMPHFQGSSRPMEIAVQRALATRGLRLGEQRESIKVASQKYVDAGGKVS